jgi:hypothetical protein
VGEEIGKTLRSDETSVIEALHRHARFCHWLREMKDSEDWSPELKQYKSVLVRLHKPLEHFALLFIDLLNLIEALGFTDRAEMPDSYFMTMVKQIVILLHELQTELNRGYLGEDFWAALEQLQDLLGTDVHETISGKLRGLLREYNREMEPHRKYLADLRNAIAAHRCLDFDRYYKLHSQFDEERIREINFRTLEFHRGFVAALDEALKIESFWRPR